MKNRKPEIAPAEYSHFLVDLLSCNNGVLPMTQVFDAIERFYGRHFSPADKRLMNVPNGSQRPKWKNNVDWAKAIGAKQGVLATVMHRKQKWLVLIEEADDFWQEKAAKKKSKRSFKKKCRRCGHWNPLKNKVCDECSTDFPPTPEKRLID
jgi:hypothetical protein